ncbi:biotin/lipoyl-binding protein [Candidatus Bathyarchaeota archaeon]|nr:biotin/lipoyl-binding protein [Candidatus Bathyarchaeota archaeon]
MPIYEIFIDGKPRKVEVTSNDERSFTVKLNDRILNVDLRPGTSNLEKQFSIEIESRKYRIELPEIDREKPFLVKAEGTTFNAQVKTPERRRTFRTPEPTGVAPSGIITRSRQRVEGTVVAPMTGKILSVKVKKGDQVKTGQILCILEAMKMENEIAAGKSGTVKDVYVSEGSAVSEGEALISIG